LIDANFKLTSAFFIEINSSFKKGVTMKYKFQILKKRYLPHYEPART